MPGRVFVFLLVGLTGLALLTSPPILRPYLQPNTTPTSTTAPTVTPEPTATSDPFAMVPTATRLGNRLAVVPTLNTPALGLMPPTDTPVPTGLLPDSVVSSQVITTQLEIPIAPTPAGIPPERLQIPRLGLDVPVEPVALVPSVVSPGVFEWGVPDHRAAGWLNTSAPFGQPGNTVLDGHHNIKGEVFRDLWTLQAGDEISLSNGSHTRRYVVDEVLILPERNQPLPIRLANARYIQPTDDERLTLVTCWPYEDNTHRTVVIAFPDPAQ